MPEDANPKPAPEELSSRVTRYCAEIELLLRQGIEHPQFEFTRQATLEKDKIRDRIALVKLIQGMANSHSVGERVLVIGADQKSQEFIPVPDPREFDSATVFQVLAKYLNPLPRIEVFNSMKAKDGSPFVLIVFASSQSRPIVAKTGATDSEAKSLLREGEIWIKEGTALRAANYDDLERMYAERIESESEKRARTRFSVWRDEMVITQQLASQPNLRIPTNDLIYGGDEGFRQYVQNLLSEHDVRRLMMLIELLRDRLVEDWYKVDGYSAGSPPDVAALGETVLEHRKDIFLPALDRLTELGLGIVKYQMPEQLLALVVDLLVEVFDTSDRLERLKMYNYTSGTDSVDVEHYWGNCIPAIQASVSARVLASYAVRRGRYEFLPPLLKRYVRPAGIQSEIQFPFCFWPIQVPITMPRGRTLFCWEYLFRHLPLEYFGSQESFLQAACQFDFLLELSSHIGVGYGGKAAADWLDKYRPNTRFAYHPDFLMYNLSNVSAVAETLYDALKRGTGDTWFTHVMIEKGMLDQLLSSANDEARVDFLAGFLASLQNTQSQYFMQARHSFPPMFEWGKKLSSMMNLYREKNRQESN
jgi:hypothetical protein